MRGRLTRYALYQLRDYVIERGLPTLLMGALLFLPVLYTLLRAGPGRVASPDLLLSTLASLLPMFGLISVILGVNGIVSNDRHKGYFRFLFAKPISATRYYLQAFVVNGLGTVLCTSAIIALYTTLAELPFASATVAYVSLYWLGAGGIGFFLSTLTRFDWIALGILWWLAQLLRPMSRAFGSRYHDVLDVLLPPAHLFTDLAESAVRGVAATPSSAMWIAGYGLLGLLAGVIALRFRPLAA